MNSKLSYYAKQLTFAFVLFWFIALALHQANPYITLASADGGSFLYIGSRMLAGDELYVDVWDHKGPGIFFVNWLGLLLVNNSRWGVWFIEYVFLYMGFFLGYLALRHKWGDGAAFIGVILGIYSLMAVLEKGNLTEEYPLLFNFFALWLFLRHGEKKQFFIYALIGASFCLSFLFRANNGGLQVAIGLTVLFFGVLLRDFQGVFKQLTGLAIGAIVVFLFVSLHFYLRGTFNAFIEGAFTYNLLDVSGSSDIWSGFVKGWGFFGIVSYIMTLGFLSAFYHLFLLIKRRQFEGDATILAFLVILWPLEILLSSLSGRNYSHYFVCWIPTTLLLVAYAYQTFSSDVFSRKFIGFFDTPKACYVILIVSMVFSYPVIKTYVETLNVLLLNRQYGIDRQHELSTYIRANTSPDDKVLVWGWGAGMNFLSRRESPSSHIFYPLASENRINDRISQQFYNDLINNKPALVVDMSTTNPDYLSAIDPVLRAQQAPKHARNYYPPYYNEVLDYIYENYELEKTIRGYDIYRLKQP